MLRRRASTLKTKITLMAPDKNMASKNDGTLLLQSQLDNVNGNTHDTAASSLHRKKLHRKLAARKQKIADE